MKNRIHAPSKASIGLSIVINHLWLWRVARWQLFRCLFVERRSENLPNTHIRELIDVDFVGSITSAREIAGHVQLRGEAVSASVQHGRKGQLVFCFEFKVGRFYVDERVQQLREYQLLLADGEVC